MKNKKILITGGAGFIGANLTLTLQETYPDNEYFVIDDFRSGDFKNLIGFRGEVIPEDVCKVDLDYYFPEGVDVIFHQAATVDTTIKDQKEMLGNNVGGFKKVLNFALKNKARLIYASSGVVYGSSQPPMKVGRGEKPLNVYGFSKLVCDNIARRFFDKYKDNVIVGLRYFNVYGPGESHKGEMASMIYKLYSQMKKEERPKLFKYGEQKRDHVYIKDVVKANILALKAKKSCIVNIGRGKAVSFNEIVEKLNNFLGTNLKPQYIDNPCKPNFQELTTADLTETKEFLGYVPDYDIEKGIKDYFENYEKR